MSTPTAPTLALDCTCGHGRGRHIERRSGLQWDKTREVAFVFEAAPYWTCCLADDCPCESYEPEVTV